MQGLANSYAFWIFVFVALVVVYLLPTLIGVIRGVDRLALVFLVNLIGAPTATHTGGQPGSTNHSWLARHDFTPTRTHETT
jgi:hypothetical protein